MEQILDFVARYGSSGAIGALILYLVLRMAKSGTFPEISIRFGRNGYRGSDSNNGSNGNGGNGNGGNGNGTKAAILEAIQAHQKGCAPDLHNKIEEYNRAVSDKIDESNNTILLKLGRLEGLVERNHRD